MTSDPQPPAAPAPEPSPPPPPIHEAELVSGPSGFVEWGNALTFEEAVTRRKQDLDIVARGEDENENRRLAGRIEAAVGPPTRPQPPHEPGRLASAPALPPGVALPKRAFVPRNGQSESQEEAMKYITPDLLVRFGSSDDKVASRASQEWEKAHAAYVAHLAAIRPQLPKPLRRLLKRFYLHDAKVLAMTLDESPSFSLYLELGKPSRPEDNFLELKYRLVGPRGMHLISHPELAGDGKALGWWQYDEVNTQKAQDDVLLFTHSILFSVGYELQLTFFSFAYRRLPFVHSTAREDDAAKILQLLAS